MRPLGLGGYIAGSIDRAKVAGMRVDSGVAEPKICIRVERLELVLSKVK